MFSGTISGFLFICNIPFNLPLTKRQLYLNAMKYFSLLFFLYYFNISVAQESTKIIFLNPSQALGSTGGNLAYI